jgi:uncharacterized membrane protein
LAVAAGLVVVVEAGAAAEAAVSVAAAESLPAAALRAAGEDTTMRWLKHFIESRRGARHFPPATLDAIQHAIAASEHLHLGEICFAVEAGLPIAAVFGGTTARDRAHAAFARLNVWNTEHNTGVLVYILVADHAIEIVADRGITAKVPEAEWQSICALMQRHFATDDYEKGALAGVAAIGEILVKHFPADGTRNPDELPDRPVFL